MNSFDSVKDLTHLTWSLARASSGTVGSFLKSYEEKDGEKYYYKMSSYDTVKGVYGHECINEMIAQNIAEILKIPHLQYELLHAKVKVNEKVIETFLTKSKDFKSSGDHKLTFETYYEIEHLDQESVWEFIERKHWQQFFYQMFLLDYIICNRDRHGANIEVLEKEGKYRLAPLFDHGISFMSPCFNEVDAMKKFDRKKDGPVNNYVGSMSLVENLKLVPKELRKKAEKQRFTRERIFYGIETALSAMPWEFCDLITKMIWERVECIEEICNHR